MKEFLEGIKIFENIISIRQMLTQNMKIMWYYWSFLLTGTSSFYLSKCHHVFSQWKILSEWENQSSVKGYLFCIQKIAQEDTSKYEIDSVGKSRNLNISTATDVNETWCLSFNIAQKRRKAHVNKQQIL